MTILQFIGVCALVVAALSIVKAVRRGSFPLEGNDGFWDGDDVPEQPRLSRTEQPIAFWFHTLSWSLIFAVIGLILVVLGK